MIKKSILIILLLMTNPITTANAGFWDAVGACFTDPCAIRQEGNIGTTGFLSPTEVLIETAFVRHGIRNLEEMTTHV